MDALNNGGTVAPPAPAPPPGVTVLNAPPSAPPAPIVAADGGEMPMPQGESPTGKFLKNINWLEMGFLVLLAAGAYYTIYYHRFKIKEDKIANDDMRRDLDELQAKVATLTEKRKTGNSNSSILP